MPNFVLLGDKEVKSVLAGQNVSLRRLVTVPWKGSRRALPYPPYWVDTDGELFACDENGEYHPAIQALPGWQVGDTLHVKETWAPEPNYEDSHDAPEYDGGGGQAGRVVFRADERPSSKKGPGLSYGVRRWRSPVHMPFWASRITLKVTNVHIERLHAVTEERVRSEGFETLSAFQNHWDKTCGKKWLEANWASNPWVRHTEFQKAGKVV